MQSTLKGQWQNNSESLFIQKYAHTISQINNRSNSSVICVIFALFFSQIAGN